MKYKSNKHTHEIQFGYIRWKVKNNLCFLNDLRVLDLHNNL